MKDDLILDGLRDLVRYAPIDMEKKEKYIGLLTPARFGQIGVSESVELMEILRNSADKLEKEIINSNDPAQINDLVEMKQFLYDTFSEAELESVGDGASLETLDSGGLAEMIPGDASSLLDRYAGVSS